VVENNVVLYTGLFDIDNSDASLLSDMTAQVYFVTSSANNVITVPIGALTYVDAPVGQGAAARPDGGGASVPPEVRARLAAGQGFAGPGGAGRGAARQVDNQSRRLATVQVVNADGSQEDREIMVGVTSRIAAEVISGLEVGEQVVAGIVQGNIPGAAAGGDPRRNFRPMGGF